MNQEKIGKFILKLRKDKKMTQQGLADKLNVTDRAVSHWENGRSIPDVALFKPICEIFGISVNELISGEKLSKEKLIKQSEAVEIAWEVAHRYFDIDNSSYYDEVYRTSPNSDRPELGWWDVYLMRRFTEKIEIQDYVLIRILPWGELQSFHGIALGLIVIPENPPDFDEVKECIETRLEDLLHKQKDKFTSPTIEIAHSVLYFDPKDDRYKITCFVNLECTKIVNDEEINVHDYIEVVVVLN